MNNSLREAPKALGTLLAIDMDKVLASSKVIKQKICKVHTDIEDRIGENYGMLLAMAGEVNSFKWIMNI